METDRHLKTTRVFLLFVILVGILYSRTIFYEAIYLDDSELITENLPFLKNLANLITSFQEDVFFSFNQVFYRPLFTVSLILDAQWSGSSFRGYHFTNIVLHLLVSIVVFKTLVRLSYSRIISVLAACFFLVHPLGVSAVAWIPGRNDLLLSLFGISSFYFLLNLDFKFSYRLILHFLFLLAALFTKESAVCFPVLFFIYLMTSFVGDRLQKDTLSSKRRVFQFSLAWTFAIATYWCMRYLALDYPASFEFKKMVASSVSHLPELIIYFGKALVPINYSTLPIVNFWTLTSGICALILFGLLAFKFRRQIQKQRMVFGFLWFFVFCLIATVRPIDLMSNYPLEHRAYTALFGVSILLSELLRMGFLFNSQVNVSESSVTRVLSTKQKACWLIAGILIFLFGGVSARRVSSYRDGVAFWNEAIATAKDSFAYKNLGNVYYQKKDFMNASVVLFEALKLNTKEPDVQLLLGKIELDNKDLQKAEFWVQGELRVFPNSFEANKVMGIIYAEKRQYALARLSFLRALQIVPDAKDVKELLLRVR